MKTIRLGLFALLFALASWPFASRAQDEDPVPTPPPAPRQPAIRLEKGANEDRFNWGGGKQAQRHEVVSYDADIVVKKNQEVREVVVIHGNATIDGNVRDSVVVIGGNAKVEGRIRHDLVVILGNAELGPQARVGGEVVVVGGEINAHETAEIRGNSHSVPLGNALPMIQGGFDWLTRGLLYARPLPPQVKWAWYGAGVFFLISVLLASLFPQPAQVCLETLEARPTAAFVTGLLTVMLFLPFIVLLAITVVGVLLVPLVICGLIGSLVFGKVVVYRFAGQQFGKQIGKGALGAPLAALSAGTALFYVLYMVPVLGLLVWGGATVLGLGTVMLAAGQHFRSNPAAGPTLVPAGDYSVSGSEDPSALSPEVRRPGLVRAGFWARFLASLLDLILLGVIAVALHFPPIMILLIPVYHVIMWSWKGTTIGGIVMGLKLVRTDGRPVDFAVSLVRSLSAFFSAMVLFLGFFWAGWDRQRQSWHDKIAGTVIVRAPKNMVLA